MIIRIVRPIIEKIGVSTLVKLLLLLTAATLLTSGLGTAVRGGTLNTFVPVGITAALLGWALASARFKGWQAWGGILILGFVLLWGATAHLAAPLLEMLSSFLSVVLYQLFLWANQQSVPVADFSAAASAWNQLTQQSAGLGQRVLAWGLGLQSGVNIEDPVVRVLAWSLLVWLVTAWAGWFIRNGRVLTGTAPALVLLGVIVDYTGTDIFPLWGLLSITLIMMGLMPFETISQSWAKRGLDYAEIILGDTTVMIVLITSLLAAAAWTIPSFSIQPIVDAIHKAQQGQGSDHTSVAQTLGLTAASGGSSGFRSYNTPKLPNRHLIGSGPELSQEMVMTVDTGELPPISSSEIAKLAPHYHWRSTTFDIYTSVGWASSAVENESYAADAPLFEAVPKNYRTLRQNITVMSDTGDKLFWAGTLYRADQPFEAGWRALPGKDSAASPAAFSRADLLGALSSAKTYRVESLLPVASLEELRAAPAVYPDFIRQNYLKLPDKIPERVLELARDVTATAPTAYDRAKAIESYLRTTYPYTLDLPAPPGDRDIVDYFLFDLKKGYCDYYASAMAVLARAAGLPARIVVGYASGAFNSSTAKYDVTQADAHAWTEVYFSNIGWVEFEPTASQPEINRPSGDTPLETNPTPPKQPGFFDGLNALRKNLPMLGLWLLLALPALALLAVVLQIGESWLLTNIQPARAVKLIYFGLYRLGRSVAGPANAGETAREFASTLDGRFRKLVRRGGLGHFFAPASRELALLTDLYVNAAYSPRSPEQAQIPAAVRAWQRLRWRLLVARMLPKKKAQASKKKKSTGVRD